MRKYIYLRVLFLTTSWICYGYADDAIGGIKVEDPKKPRYYNMAKEVVLTHIGVKEQDLKKITVYKVTTQVVAGLSTTIQFQVLLVNYKSTMCEAKIWEKPWEKTKIVIYNCDSQLSTSSKKLSLALTSRPPQLRDPKNPKYMKLATLALDSYFKSPGRKLFDKNDVESVSLKEVKVQINTQIMTNVIFNVNTTNDAQFKCKGVVMETPWESISTTKVIEINCDISKGNEATSYYMGGQTLQNPEDPKYEQLAKDSFAEYRKKHIGPLFVVKEYRVIKVTTAVVAGTMTRIDFNVITDSSYKYQCYSEILEQQWRKIKNIKVKCNPIHNLKLSMPKNGKKLSEDINTNLELSQPNNTPEVREQSYIDKAITDYFNTFDKTSWTVEQSETRSSSQVQTRKGKENIDYYKVDAYISNPSGDYCYYNCSVVFGTRNHWIDPNPIGVNCIKSTKLLGRTDWDDPSKEEYLLFALDALKKYIAQEETMDLWEGNYDVIVTFITKGLAAGYWYSIHFIVRPTEDIHAPGLICFANIWQDLKGKHDIKNVNCNPNMKN